MNAGPRGFLALLLASVIPAVGAADAAGNYAIWGAGARSCNQYLGVAADAPASASYRDYLMGYLTAYNTLAADTYNAVGAMKLPEVVSWIDAYCAGHKMDSFERAVTQLIVDHQDERLHAPAGSNRGWGRTPAAPAAASVD